MDFVIDFIFELFFEIFGEGFLSLCSAFVPERYLTERSKKIVGKVFMVIACILLLGLLLGISLVCENGKSALGWILIALNIVYVVLGITLKIISSLKIRSCCYEKRHQTI